MFQIDKDRFKRTFLKKLKEQGYNCSMHEGDVVMQYCDKTFWLFLTDSLHGGRMVRVAIQNRYPMNKIDELSWEWKKAIMSEMNYEYPTISNIDYDNCFVSTYQCDVHSVRELMNGLLTALDRMRAVEMRARRDFDYLLGQYGKVQTCSTERHIGFRQTSPKESDEPHIAAHHNDSSCD